MKYRCPRLANLFRAYCDKAHRYVKLLPVKTKPPPAQAPEMKTDTQIRANRNPNIKPIANEADAEKFAAKLRSRVGGVRVDGSNGQVGRPWEFKGPLVLPTCPKCNRVPDMCYCSK